MLLLNICLVDLDLGELACGHLSNPQPEPFGDNWEERSQGVYEGLVDGLQFEDVVEVAVLAGGDFPQKVGVVIGPEAEAVQCVGADLFLG